LARTLGYTVVDASTAVATHLNKVLRDNASDLLSHDEVQQLLDKLAAKSPKLVEDLVPGKLSLGVVTRTLQNLLNESVSIRDMRTIAETLSEVANRTQEPEQLTALVRPKLCFARWRTRCRRNGSPRCVGGVATHSSLVVKGCALPRE